MKQKCPRTKQILDMTIIVEIQGQNVKIYDLNIKYHGKKHAYKKCKSPITCHLKDMTNVKIFEKWVKLQGQDHKVKNYGTNRKFL
jgi:hypothetical protein